MGPRMQEDGEILSDRLESLPQHLLGRRADDHKIAVLDRHSEELVTHRTAHTIDLHKGVSGGP